MSQNIKYIGCFLDYQALHEKLKVLGKDRLEILIKHPHVTFCYHPEAVDAANFGKKVTVKAVGYGNDSFNEGLKVEVITYDPKLWEMADKIEVKHITISISKYAEPVDTKNLEFVPIEPFLLEATFGAFTFDNKVIFK